MTVLDKRVKWVELAESHINVIEEDINNGTWSPIPGYRVGRTYTYTLHHSKSSSSPAVLQVPVSLSTRVVDETLANNLNIRSWTRRKPQKR